MAIASHSTIYDVVTRYRTEDLSARHLAGYTRGADRATRSTNNLRTSIVGSGRGLRMVARFAGPAIAGMTAFAGVGFAVMKSFRNLNEEMNATLQLGTQINLAADFSADPIDNFNASLRASKGLVRDLVKDAAMLPGELSDFIDIARMTGGAIFAGGGDIKRIRAMTARLALAAPAAGATGREAGRQAMRTLFGTASVGDNPLFAMLQGSKLLPETTTFNALTAAKRLELFDEALKKLTDNPMFREKVIHTFDTQLGTLTDLLVGIEGIGGQALASSFENILSGLEDLNLWLEKNADSIVRLLGGGQILSQAALNAYLGPGAPPTKSRFLSGVAGLLGTPDPASQRASMIDLRARRMLEAMLIAPGPIGMGMNPSIARSQIAGSGFLYDPGQKALFVEYQAIAARQLDRAILKEKERQPFKAKDLPQTKIEQVFNVKLDLKSDTSPEAIAVKLTKALATVGRHPTTSQRALSPVPGTSATQP